MTKKFLPITVVIATLNRPAILQRTLASLAEQDALPTQIVIIDGSAGDDTQVAVGEATFSAGCSLTWQRATHLGAAAQRNQGVKLATQPYIWFCDDDIVLEPECLARLWQAINSDSTFGGVNAMITNQRYNAPGRVTRTLYRLLDGKSRDCYAGKCIGPALNILPQDDPNLAEVVPVEWLNTTCTLYRREALPSPPFDEHFTGYSLMEDLALSLRVGKNWKLANARTARIFHDSQSGEHKRNRMKVAKMQLVNRHYVMVQVLQKRGASDYAKFALLQVFELITSVTSKSGLLSLPANLAGRVAGAIAIASLSNPIPAQK